MDADRLATGVLTCTKCTRLCAVRDGYAVPAEVGEEYRSGHRVAFMAEAPGAQEAATSRPLVGPAGQLFERMLAECSLRREQVMLTNRVRCRPPRNQLKDFPEALLACDYWTEQEFTLYDPQLVVLMGNTALKPIFGDKRVGELRGLVRMTGPEHPWGRRLWTVTYHPASALPRRSPENAALIVKDIRNALAVLRSNPWPELSSTTRLESTEDSGAPVAPPVGRS